MASTNQSPAYQKAQGKFLEAQTTEQKLKYLKDMIRECPKHKSSEKMLANLKTRYRKLKYTKEKEAKRGKSTQQGIRKEEMQAVIIGKTNTGKSSLLSLLTNASPYISNFEFTTKKPIVGMMNYLGTPIQVIENPAFESEYYDKGLMNSADTILIIVTDLNQIEEIKKDIKSRAKQIIVFNSKNKTEQEVRKTRATLQSKKYDFIIADLSQRGGRPGFAEGLGDLKEKLFKSFGKIRIYTKEPGKDADKSRPVILQENSTIEKVAEKILHGGHFAKQVKEIKIWGPSSKFSGQVVGLKHKLKDLDIVEFKTR